MMEEKPLKLKSFAKRFTSLGGIQAIRRGLISIIPVLLVGAFALVIKSFPIAPYQQFLSTFAKGFVLELLDEIYNVTFGLLSLYMCISMSYHYSLIKSERGSGASVGCAVVSLACFVIFTGIESLSADTLGPKGMFIAIISAICASAVFCLLLAKTSSKRLMTDGADVNLNNALRLILPICITILFFALLNSSIILVSGGVRVHGLILNFFNWVFSLVGDGFFGGLLFVVVSSVLWFFGIHGSDVLEGVATSFFTPKIDINIALEAAGQAPTEILTKQFFDIFVLMGGCGSAMCLLIALLIFGKRRSNKGLAKMAAFPMIFNINEIMVFGLPIIYNPVLIIPFLCVPIVCFLTSYAAMCFGIVPMITSSVEWTIPVILGGYLGTGSFMGSLLQIFNLALGVMIYRPFVKKYDEERLENAKSDYKHLVDLFREKEQNREPVTLTDLSGPDGAFAKALAADITHAIEEKTLKIYYQPQFNLAGECFGAEALLRFEEPSLGMIYPPLVIALAKESGRLQALEKYIFEKVKSDAEILSAEREAPLKVSVNISGASIQSKEFEHFLIDLAERYSGKSPICIEITEQDAIIFNDELKDRMLRLREAGYMFAIDDFSAGNTSLQYLQENSFDIVKLDGSIVQNCITNPRCNEFTTMIIELSHNLGFSVIAEFVSSKEIRDCMARAGCTMYQGWFYSKAIELDDLRKMLKSE